MPLYFFDIIDAGVIAQDGDGTQLENDQEARDQAIALLPDIARDEMPDGDRHEITASVRNESGQVVYEATLNLHGRWWPGGG